MGNFEKWLDDQEELRSDEARIEGNQANIQRIPAANKILSEESVRARVEKRIEIDAIHGITRESSLKHQADEAEDDGLWHS